MGPMQMGKAKVFINGIELEAESVVVQLSLDSPKNHAFAGLGNEPPVWSATLNIESVQFNETFVKELKLYQDYYEAVTKLSELVKEHKLSNRIAQMLADSAGKLLNLQIKELREQLFEQCDAMTATGKHLDCIGASLGVDRLEGDTDDEYRLRLLERVRR